MDKRQILIIEDDKDTAVLFNTVLTLAGFECEIVLSAKEALARLASTIPNIILLDLHLGLEIGGEDILYQIRSNPRFDETRVVVVTAYPSSTELVTSLADLILFKPVDIGQLRTLVARVDSSKEGPKLSPFMDPITRLFNKDFFYTRLELAIERARRRQGFLFAVVLLEIQIKGQPKALSDPDIGINLLKEVGERLKRNVRPTDTLARFTRWRFAGLLEEFKQPEDLQVIIDRLQACLSEPFKLGEKEFPLLVHFGAVIYNREYSHPNQILAAAEQTLQ